MSKKHKYGVAPKSDRTWKGEVYDSKKEMLYAQKLELLKKAVDPHKRVVGVEKQIKFPFVIGGIKICTYKLDFKVTYTGNRVEYIDVKGVKTPVYRIKKKLMQALYGIDIKEV